MAHKRNFIFSWFAAMILMTAWSCSSSASDQQLTEAIQAGPEDSIRIGVERGRHLVHHVTGFPGCHLRRDYNSYSCTIISGTEGKGGVFLYPELVLRGQICSPAITYTALGDGSDEELERLITGGISHKGDSGFLRIPDMAYAQMAETEVRDIIRYMRDLAPIEQTFPSSILFIPLEASVPSHPKPGLSKNMKESDEAPVNYGNVPPVNSEAD